MSASRNAVVYNETKSYDLPVFVIEPKIIDGKVYSNIVLDRCSIARNFNNVSYNNNCLRWLRTVPLDSSTKRYELRLCSLYLPQGYYKDMNELIIAMNSSLKEAINAIFKSTTIEHPKHLVYQYTGTFNNKAFDIDNASFTSLACTQKENKYQIAGLQSYPDDLIKFQLSEYTPHSYQWNAFDIYRYILFARPDILASADVSDEVKALYSTKESFENEFIKLKSENENYIEPYKRLLESLQSTQEITNGTDYVYATANIIPSLMLYCLNKYASSLTEVETNDAKYTETVSAEVMKPIFGNVNVNDTVINDSVNIIYNGSVMDEILTYFDKHTNFGIAIVNLIVNYLLEWDGTKPIPREAFRKDKIKKSEFVTRSDIILISNFMSTYGFFEINTETLWSIVNSKYFLDWEDDIYLTGLEDIAKCLMNRLLNSFLNKNRYELNIQTVYDFLSTFYDDLNSFKNNLIIYGRSIGINEIADIDVYNETFGEWATVAPYNTLTVEMERLKSELDSFNETDIPSYIQSIQNAWNSNEMIHAQRLEETCRKALQLQFLDKPCYYYEAGNVKVIVSINSNLINNLTAGNFSLEQQVVDGEITLLQEDAYIIEDGTAANGNGTTQNIINSFETLTDIPSGDDATIYTYINGRLAEVDGAIVPAKTILKHLNFIPLINNDAESSASILRYIYVVDGKFSTETASISLDQITSEELSTFTRTVVERYYDNDSPVVVISNSELLNDPYFANLQAWKEDAWKLEGNDIYFSAASILPVSLNDDYTPNIKDYTRVIGRSHNDCVYVKGAILFEEDEDGIGHYAFSSNQYIISSYNNQNKKIDDTNFKYTQFANDLWFRSGFASNKISFNPINAYFVKTYNYTEEGFDGTITIDYNAFTNRGKVLPQGLEIGQRLYQLIGTTLLSNRIAHISSFALTLSPSLVFSTTVNKDVGKFTDKIEGIYSVDIDMESTSPQMIIPFSNTARISIPENGKVYIYITGDEQPFTLANGRYTLWFTYVE